MSEIDRRYRICPECGGLGWYYEPVSDGEAIQAIQVQCEYCYATGEVEAEEEEGY